MFVMKFSPVFDFVIQHHRITLSLSSRSKQKHMMLPSLQDRFDVVDLVLRKFRGCTTKKKKNQKPDVDLAAVPVKVV